MSRTTLLFLLSYFLLPLHVYCWWETGHEVVARLAAARLTPAAQTRIAKLLGVADTKEAVADALAQASLWADILKKTETQTASWHFIDIALQDPRSAMPERCQNDDCVTARIRQFAAQLSAKAAPADSHWSDLDALRFVVHFVGDVHQPLHDSSNADLGGNCETLNPAVHQAKNVHALWDGPLVDRNGPDDKAIAADLEIQIAALSNEHQKKISEGSEDDWAWEAHRLARPDIYRRLRIPTEAITFPVSCAVAPAEITGRKINIRESYIDEMKPVVRYQLIKGGLRLANLLNQTL